MNPKEEKSNYQYIGESLTEILVEDYQIIKDSANPAILAKLTGAMFFVNKSSRNQRWYSKELWENQLNSENLKWKLKNGMLGTLQHPIEPSQFHPVHSSHTITKLWIDKSKNIGLGEEFILNTPVGQIVHTFFRSGKVKLYSSSRAYGEFLQEWKEGVQVLDPSKFQLETFDKVTDPGFLDACPKIVESVQEQFIGAYWKSSESTDLQLSHLRSHYKVQKWKNSELWLSELAKCLVKDLTRSI